MPLTVQDLRINYSGGAGNSNPYTSLGGVRSSVRVPSQSVSAPVNITGVTVTSAFGNTSGIGLMTWSSSTNTLSWQPPGGATTYLRSFTADGTYLLGGTYGSLIVTVVYASMPASYKQDSLTVAATSNNVFDSVSAIDSLTGSVEYRCLYFVNASTTNTANATRVWIKTLTEGVDEIDIGVDIAGIGDGSTTGVAASVVNEKTAPVGVTFSRPQSYATGIVLGDVPAGSSVAFWERRTVPVGSTGNLTYNNSAIAVAASS